jgi:GPH family glycoside/pentoside/hexuronide:cation symporter
MATAMVGTLGYYATVYYVCKGDVEMGAKWNTLMGVSGMVFGLVGIPFSVWLSKRVGKRNALLVILALAICAFIGDWFFYNPNIPWLQLFASGFVAFTGAGFWTIYGSTLADVIESDELDTGLRREGSFSACASWISKAGLALGNLGSGWVLQFTGFNADLPAQSDDAIFLMRVFLSGIPAVGLLLAIIVIAGFGLTEKRMYEIRNELEARRGAV